jgi:hypothetical protein
VERRDGGYFVRVGRAEPGTAAPAGRIVDPIRESLPEPPRRRRRAFTVRPLPFLLLALVAWVAWASQTEGGVTARVEDLIDRGRDAVVDATTDPNLKRAATFYNERYELEGRYPKLTQTQLRNDPEAGFGIGVDVHWCSNAAIVLQSRTGHGSISRLLLRGVDVGDVSGEVDCPVDLTNPQPWDLTAE